MVAVHAASPAPSADLASGLGSLLLAHNQIVVRRVSEHHSDSFG